MDYLKGCSTRSLGGAGLFSTGLLRQEAMERTGGGLGGSAVAMLPTVPFELAREESPRRAARHPLNFFSGTNAWGV